MVDQDVARIVRYCREQLPLSTARLGAEFSYSSLALCVIDSVYAPGVRYESVRNTIARYCAHLGCSVGECRVTADELVRDMEALGIAAYADGVFGNRQRTSPRGGILKAEAVYRFAQVLARNGINTREDVLRRMPDPAIARQIEQIPGHGSGLSIKYLLMGCGAYHTITPDRMILRFLRDCLGHKPTEGEAERLLSLACRQLQDEFPNVTPALLDNQIWQFQREHEK